MARNSKVVAIGPDGKRDAGRHYLITEMPPRRAEKWASRALLAITAGGRAEIPDDWKSAGMASLAVLGLRAFGAIPFELAEPLLDEMMTCVAFVPDPSKVDAVTREPITRPLIEDDIDEVATILRLRSEVFEVHTGFSPAALLSTLGEKAKAALADLNSSDTQTLPKASE